MGSEGRLWHSEFEEMSARVEGQGGGGRDGREQKAVEMME